MKIGFIISMYDEINQVTENIKMLKNEKCPIVVIQSDPKLEQKILDKNLVDFYELLPDLAGSKEQYLTDRIKIERGSMIPARALTRNFSRAFFASKSFDVEWWMAILGDVKISNLVGIKKIIQKMSQLEKSVGVTRAIGQVFLDDNSEFTRIQKNDTTDFMPQFFVVKSDLIQQGLFNQITITNKYATEQCLGDEVSRYCKEKGIQYFDLCYSICDYAYPHFIEGLRYNPDRAKLPKHVDSIINALRRFRRKLLD